MKKDNREGVKKYMLDVINLIMPR